MSDPVAWCSPGQLANLMDVDADGGVYLPIRKTERGNFTMPLYSQPVPVSGDLDVLRAAVKNLLPIGNASAPGDRVFPIYVRMDELRALHALATPATSA